MAANAMKNVNKKQFKDYTKEQQEELDKCIICYCEFEASEEIAELNCDARHIFHTECI